MPKLPLTVRLSGEDGNAFSILGGTCQAMREAGISEETIKQYFAEATSSDYQHLLAVTAEYVNIE